MADSVFVNGRSAISAGSSGQSMAFPDVNLCPPTPPAGPIPTPLPNIAMAADLQGGASSVLIAGNPMAKKSSFFAKSTGNEVAQPTGGGVVSAVVQGKAYFVSYSFDVTVEGEEAPRHLDMMTHNHAAQSPPNSAMGTYLGMMNPALMPPASDPPPPRDDKQPIEIFMDKARGVSPAGADSVLLVSDDGRYKKSLPLTAASTKGGLYCFKFDDALPGRAYSLYWQVGSEKIALFEHVPFREIAVHAPGAEKPDEQPPPAPPQQATSDGGDPPPDHPDEWYDPGPWKRTP